MGVIMYRISVEVLYSYKYDLFGTANVSGIRAHLRDR